MIHPLTGKEKECLSVPNYAFYCGYMLLNVFIEKRCAFLKGAEIVEKGEFPIALCAKSA